MKVTTEKLPKSLVALDIELERDQVEKGLDRAARRLSQKYAVPGFRKGKAPRFIIENYFGREALLEEASEDLVNKAYKKALEQEQLTPAGPASLESVDPSEPFRIRVTVPVPPTITLPDYRAIQVPFTIEPVTDEMLNRSMEVLRDKHVVLKELDEPRPAQQGDQITAKMETIVEGQPLEKRDEDEEIPESTLVLEPDRLVDELYEALLGMQVDERREVTSQMPDDHANEEVRGKEVTFNVEMTGMQERLLPDWEELPTLEEFDGTIDELREKTRTELETTARNAAEREVVDSYIDQLVEQTEYDVPDVIVRDMAEDMLENQGRQFAQYGITLDQMLQYRGQTRDEALDVILPDAERQVKVRLALQNVVGNEQLDITDEEIDEEVEQIVQDYGEEERENAAQVLSGQLRMSVANAVLDRKLRERLLAIATGEAPALPDPADDTAAEETTETETPATATQREYEPEPAATDVEDTPGAGATTETRD